MGERIHKAFPTWLAIVACVFVFLGERAFAGDDTMRIAFAGLAALFIAIAKVVRLREYRAGGPDKQAVGRRLMWTTAGVGLALVLYGLIAVVFVDDTPTHERMRGVLWALWPVVLAVSIGPMIAIELAVLPVAFIGRYEHARINKNFVRALSFALFVSCLVVANYLANRHDTKWELSAGHSAVASEQTTRAVRDLTKPVEVVLFYAQANEVAERLERYFEPLVAANDNLTLRRIDYALAGEMAKDAKVTENGYVAILQGNVSEKVRVGATARNARSALRRFDGNFIKALVKVTTSKKTAYFTAGHGERAIGTPDKDDARTPVKLVKQQLEAWQYTVKELSVANGLADEIPDDAGLILIMGPEKPFLRAEIDALKKATDKGVRIFFALEAERSGDPMTELLAALGLSFDKTLLANESDKAPITRSKADRYHIYSTKFSSHASVTTMTRNARRLATVFDKTGSLKKVDGAMDRVKTEMVIHSLDSTFKDLDGDLEFDRDTEKKERVELAAAVVRTSTTGKKDDEARIFVLSDVDVVGDELIKLIEGNIYLLRDAVLWLKKDAEPVAPTISEEDVKIVHRGEEDSLVFYGTTFGVPGLVILAGWFANRRRRRS